MVGNIFRCTTDSLLEAMQKRFANRPQLIPREAQVDRWLLSVIARAKTLQKASGEKELEAIFAPQLKRLEAREQLTSDAHVV